MSSCDKSSLDNSTAEAGFMGYEGQIEWLVDGSTTDVRYEDMLTRGYDIYFIALDGKHSVQAFTTPEKAQAWGDPLGYEVSERHAFEADIADYADKHGLDDDSVEPLHLAYQEQAYEHHFGRSMGGGLSARGTGLVWKGCEGAGGANQVLNTKPFFTQRSWRNEVSSFTGITVFTRWTLYDRSWYRRSLGSWVVNGGGWTTLCGSGANDRTNSVVVL